MNSLKHILEGILNNDFDITDDDINPVRDFVQKYKSNYKSKGSYFIKSTWEIAEMEDLLKHYGRKICDKTMGIDFAVEVPKAHKNKETIVLVQPDSNFCIFVPKSRNIWVLYTCDSAYVTATMFKGFEYATDELIGEQWLYQKAQMWVLKNDKFLKDIQKYLK